MTDSKLQSACDTHVHIIGDQSQYPMVQDRRYTPGLASVADLQAHLERQGLTRAVIVQPSVYGFDNRCMLAALAAMQGQARGVAVLPESITTAQIQEFDAQGVRGIRLNIESTGHFNAADLASQLKYWGARLAELGWHIQVYAPMAWLASCEAVIEACPVPVVLDHFALWTEAACNSEQARKLLGLLESGKLYIKLSASYRVPVQDAGQLRQLAQQLVRIRPDRLLWGSDWPHTNREAGRGALEVSRYRQIDPKTMRLERLGWLLARDGSDWQSHILIENPARLYRF